MGPLAATLAVFDGGARSAKVRIARADHDEAASDYRETVLTAFQQVENGLAGQRILARQQAAQELAVQSSRRAVEIARREIDRVYGAAA